MNKKLYQTAGKKDDPFKNLIDVTNGIPKNYKQVGGKLINLTKTSDKEKEISIGVYHIVDGKKVLGFPPVKGTVPRSRKSGGVKMYKKGGMKMYQNAGAKDEFENPYTPGTRGFNKYENYLNMPLATRNVNADFFNPKLSGSLLGTSLSGNPDNSRISLMGNYNPSLINAGPDQNWSMPDFPRSRFRMGPSLSVGQNMNMRDNLTQTRGTLGLNTAFQTPLNNSGSLVLGGESEIGGRLFGRDIVHSGGRDISTKSAPLYGMFEGGLGYYPKDKNYGLKANIGYGTEGSVNPGLSYGISGNYGPMNLSFGKMGNMGTMGTIGLNLPIGMGNRKVKGDPVRQKMGGIKKYQNAGMYGDNTLSGAGQGMPQLGTTSTIVGQETDPTLQANRMQNLQQVGQTLGSEADRLRSSITQQEIQDQQRGEMLGEQAGLQYGQQFDAYAGTVGKGVDLATSTLMPDVNRPEGMLSALSTAKDAYGLTKAANMANTANQVGMTAGSMDAIADVAGSAGGFPMSSAVDGSTIIADAAGNTVSGGSAIGSGLKSLAKNPNVLAMAADYGGQLIRNLSDDDDPTKSNFGEYAGSAISYGGKGAGLGTMIMPGVGTAIGAGVGALVGAGKEFFGAKSAREAEEEYLQEARNERNRGIYDLNKRVGSAFGSAMNQMAAGNIAQKTVSGQNLGRNVMYKHGGMMMRMPRYGYKL
jgi:hypothetical protein